jgi:hypothetical protein
MIEPSAVKKAETRAPTRKPYKGFPMTDPEFTALLSAHLAQFTQDAPAVPLFNKADGSIDREKTLALPCYAGLEQ